MFEETVTLLANAPLIEAYYRLDVHAPRIAPHVRPGQFAHLRILPLREALLRRPFSIFQASGNTFSILYKVVGRGTSVLAQMRPGESLNALGPLGHGFTVPAPDGEIPWLVAGGYGMAALYLLARQAPVPGRVFVGGRRRADILCEREFQDLGWEVQATTEDGSHGVRGLVTGPLVVALQRGPGRVKLFACGPTPMLRAVATIAAQFGLPAELSLDEPMCCGVGVCLTCVVPIRTATGWEYQRACTEGPVFNARDVLWEVPADGAASSVPPQETP